MKKLIIAPVAAVVMLGLSGYANASENENGVDISKHVHITNHVNYAGGAYIGGYVSVNRLGMAAIDNNQYSTFNNVENHRNTNNATLGGGSANNLAGNSGINIAGGDNNVQANNTALTALSDCVTCADDNNSGEGGEGGEGNPAASKSVKTGWDKHGGASVDAEIGSNQTSGGNYTNNQGNHNNATVSGGSLNDSNGNLGVNVAAGSGNVQANSFALSYGKDASLAVSTVENNQANSGNNTNNATLMSKKVGSTVGITMFGSNIGGTYKGDSVQSNDVYPEIWEGGTAANGHKGGTYKGHMDFDGSPLTSGDKPSSGNDGHFEFAENGTIDLGLVVLSGGVTTYNTIVGRTNVNNAVLSGGSLNNAAGNVGLNVAAGTNNLQSNNMALSVGGEF